MLRSTLLYKIKIRLNMCCMVALEIPDFLLSDYLLTQKTFRNAIKMGSGLLYYSINLSL